MTPAYARDALQRALAEHGEPITIRRISPGANVDCTVLARITGFSPEELASGMMQGNRKAIVSAADVEASGFPLPFQPRGVDKVVARGATMTIQSVDDSTRRVAGVLIAYELGITG